MWQQRSFSWTIGRVYSLICSHTMDEDYHTYGHIMQNKALEIEQGAWARRHGLMHLSTRVRGPEYPGPYVLLHF